MNWRVCVRTAVFAAAAPLLAQDGALRVGPNVLVSGASPDRQLYEVIFASHPTDPNLHLACTMADAHQLAQRRMDTLVFASRDGGRSWTKGPTISISGDPVCKFGPDGTAYFGALTSNPPSTKPEADPLDWKNEVPDPWNFVLYRTTDGGAHWELRGELWSGDRPWLGFDNAGQLILTYQSRAVSLDYTESDAVALDMTFSSDQGKTWSLPKAFGVLYGKRLYHSLPTGVATLSDGTIVVSNWQNLRADIADPAGTPKFPGLPPPPTCEITVTRIPPDRWRRAKTVKAAEKHCSETSTTRVADSMAVDARSAAFKDRVYLAWTDNREGSARILFASSRDGGLSWTRPRRVDDLPPSAARGLTHEPDNFMAQLAVNRDGVVGLAWHDRRDSPDNIGYSVRFRASLDGGETWLPSVRVSEKPSRFRSGERVLVHGYARPGSAAGDPVSVSIGDRFEFHAGDTGGLDADASGDFRVLWIDNRSGVDQLYTAPVSVAGKGVKNGSPEVSDLEDVSSKVVVELADVAFDVASRVVTAEILVRNPSDVPLRGRLVGRVVSLESAFGVPVLLDGGPARGVGALVDFTPTLSGGGLAAKAASGRRTLKFRIDDFRLPRARESHKNLGSDYVAFELQMLGQPSPAETPPGKEKP